MRMWFKEKRWRNASSRCLPTRRSTTCTFTSRAMAVTRAASSARSTLLIRQAKPAANALAKAAQCGLETRAEARRKLGARVERAGGQRLAHEIADDMQRVVRALAPVIAAQRDPCVVETDPRSHDELWMHQHEPAIGVVLRGSGFARHIGTNAVHLANGAAGSTIDRAAQHVDQMDREFGFHHALGAGAARFARVGQLIRCP